MWSISEAKILQNIDIQDLDYLLQLSLTIDQYSHTVSIPWMFMDCMATIKHPNMSLPQVLLFSVPTQVLNRPPTCDMGDGDDQTQGSG